jgi:hypothetical protein
MAHNRSKQESGLESVIDSAFYFPAGSVIPQAEGAAELQEWDSLPGEEAAVSAARRATLEQNKQIVQQLCTHTLRSVHTNAFDSVQGALLRGSNVDDVPSVLLHTGRLLQSQQSPTALLKLVQVSI